MQKIQTAYYGLLQFYAASSISIDRLKKIENRRARRRIEMLLHGV